MPVAGLPRNPEHVTSFTRFHRLPFVPMSRLQSDVIRHTVQEPGSIRRFWRGVVRSHGGPSPFSWTRNGFDGEPASQGFVSNRISHIITTRNTLHVGNDLSRPMARPVLVKSTASAAPREITNGNVQGRPVLRARIPSFGSRVPALNG